MSGRLIDMLLRLAPRERLLLALLALVAIPAGVILGVLLPLQEARDTVLNDRSEAAALNLWMQERVEEVQTLAQEPTVQRYAPIGTSGIEQQLIKVGLRDAVRELSGDGDGAVALRFDDVRFTRLAGWLSSANADWGYDITQFRIEASETSGNVAASLSLTPQEQ